MSADYESKGYFSEEELKDDMPPGELLKRKKTAVVECLQSIPCNACLHACKFSALKKGDINEPPKVDWEKCNACLQCIRECPGLAMFVLTIKDGKAQITIPWEMPYVPKVGDTVDVLDRKGGRIGRGAIVRVVPPIKKNKTYLVTLETDEKLVTKARNFRRKPDA